MLHSSGRAARQRDGSTIGCRERAAQREFRTMNSGTLGESVWASLPIAALAVDGSDRVIDANPAAETLLNSSARTLAGRPVAELTSYGSNLGDSMDQVRARQSPMLLHDCVIAAPGREKFLASLHIAPIMDAQNRLLLCIRSREFAGRIDHGERTKKVARSAIGLADMLSHEIRNPLSGIVGAAQLLAMKLQGEDLELTELIVGEAYRIRKLVEQVDQFGNTEASDCAALNVHDLLNHARRLARVGFGAGVSINSAYDPSLPDVWAERDKLLRVFLNLIQNACEALQPSGGRILIRTFYDGFLRVRNTAGEDQALPVHVEVIDDGPGLSPEMAQNAFEPFVSGRKNGTGLGLALVSAILNDIGGWIAFNSEPGKTVFRVSLPVAPANGSKE